MQTNIYRYMTFGAVLLCMHVILVHSKTLRIATALNHQQCQRLCWYRALCIAYSVTSDSVSSGDATCLLHTDPWEESDVPTGWLTHNANNEGIQHACRIRRCDTTQTCVPVGHSLTEYKCLTLPIDCGTPLHPSNGVFTVHGTGVGQVASLSCDQHFVVVPQNAATQITCTGSAGWTTLEVSCHQVSFTGSLTVPFTGKLPWPVSVGWEACVKGTFLGNGQMVINFLSDKYDFLSITYINYPEVLLELAFRDLFQSMTHSVAMSEKTSSWSVLDVVPGMPLNADDSFVMTLHLNDSHLTAVLHPSVYSASMAWTGRVDLLSTTYLAINLKVQLEYVNLVSTQGCL